MIFKLTVLWTTALLSEPCSSEQPKLYGVLAVLSAVGLISLPETRRLFWTERYILSNCDFRKVDTLLAWQCIFDTAFQLVRIFFAIFFQVVVVQSRLPILVTSQQSPWFPCQPQTQMNNRTYFQSTQRQQEASPCQNYLKTEVSLQNRPDTYIYLSMKAWFQFSWNCTQKWLENHGHMFRRQSQEKQFQIAMLVMAAILFSSYWINCVSKV